MRTFVSQVEIEEGLISKCPTDLGEWAVRIPFSTIWTYGHDAQIACDGEDTAARVKHFIIIFYTGKRPY